MSVASQSGLIATQSEVNTLQSEINNCLKAYPLITGNFNQNINNNGLTNLGTINNVLAGTYILSVNTSLTSTDNTTQFKSVIVEFIGSDPFGGFLDYITIAYNQTTQLNSNSQPISINGNYSNIIISIPITQNVSAYANSYYSNNTSTPFVNVTYNLLRIS